MATTSVPTDFSPAAQRRIDPAKYTALADFIDEINKPDNRESLVKTYGDQGITGFLQMTGATKAAGTNDEVQWWEETRLHPQQPFNYSAGDVDATASTFTATLPAGTNRSLRNNDVVLFNGNVRGFVTGVPTTADATGAATCTVNVLDGDVGASATATATDNFSIIGNLFAQGSDQNDAYLESQVNKKTNGYMIIKEVFKVTGSQATNIGWVNLGGGDYRWYVKGEADTRKRFMDKREMMMLLGQASGNAFATGIDGSQGYFAALEQTGAGNGGIVFDTGTAGENTSFDSLSDIDAVIKELDKQGANPEYAMYLNTQCSLNVDDMIAQGVNTATAGLTAGVASQFGAFNNDKDLAVQLGFKSFSRGGYTFHKHSWKLLNEPTLLNNSGFAGVMIPMSTVVDPKTGDRNPSLEMNFKSAGGYSRDMEHFITGSILGANTDTQDFAQFNYRSEVCLVTRAANRHVLLTQTPA
jgi:hypothetical protein